MVASEIPRRIISDVNNDFPPFTLDLNSSNIMSKHMVFNKAVIDLDDYESGLNFTPTPNDASRPPCTNRIKAYYQNVRGLRTKTSDFLLSSTSCDHDVIALTETSLHPYIYDGELFNTKDFIVYRCDRSELNSDHERLGGTLIAVRSHIKSELVTVPGIECIEMVIVKLVFERMNVFVCCIYIPSGSPIETYRLCHEGSGP